MIERVSISDIATYNKEGIVIDNLGTVNYIYGANGVGKSTLASQIFQASQGDNSHCELKWKDDIVLDTFVYDKTFREKNFASSDIPGVFTLGQATKEQLEEIEQLKAEKRKVQTEYTILDNTFKTKEEEQREKQATFTDDIWEKYKKGYESVFKEAMSGVLNKKSNFLERLLEYYELNKDLTQTYDIAELTERAKQLFGKQPEALSIINFVNIQPLLEIENNPVWNKVIVGSQDIPIAKIINELGNGDWVHKGMEYLTEDSDVCPFCQQHTITPESRKQLSAYFDASYLKDIETLNLLKNQYSIVAREIYQQLKNILSLSENQYKTIVDPKQLTTFIEAIYAQFENVTKTIDAKIKEPSRKLSITSSASLLSPIVEYIAAVNDKIKKHNDIVTNFSKEKKKLIDDFWKFLVEEAKVDLDRYSSTMKGISNALKNLSNKKSIGQAKLAKLTAEIAERNKNVTSVQATVDEINSTLLLYGFENFKIVTHAENQYQLQRADGSLANRTLSEGEMSFVTFLYFMQLIKGNTDSTKASTERIVVIDDPVSSLDSTVLFVVATMIKEKLQDIRNGVSDIKQMFILTHNVYFHKEVAFIDMRTKERNSDQYWMLRKKNNISHIQSYGKNNPIKDSCKMLWDELKNSQDMTPVTLQNTMRRIYEMYFQLLGKYTSDEVLSKFDNVQEKEICRSLLSWVNDGSHSVYDDLYIESPDEINSRYLEVFRLIFKKLGHIEHYEMMMKDKNDV